MIDVMYLDSSNSRQPSSKEMRTSHDPVAFAKKLEDASKKTNNRRQDIGKTAEEPQNGQGRRAWAHERSRADQMKEVKRISKETNDDLDMVDQGEAVESGHNMLMWLLDMPEVFVDFQSLLVEEDTLISEDAIKDMLLWMQAMTEVDNLPEELNALAEKLSTSLQDQYGFVLSDLSSEQKAEMQAFMLQVDRLMETLSMGKTDIKSDYQEVVLQSALAAEVISENTPNDITKMKEMPAKPEVVFNQETIINKDQDVKNVMTGSSDNQLNEKELAPQEKTDDVITNEQSRETVIPFSLAQIETILQQNTSTNELNQQHTQVQQNVLQQVIDKIQVIHGTTQSFVSLQLTPEHLGKLTIQLTSDLQQGMTAKIYAETPQAKEMIESNFGQLKDALSGKGVNLTAMEVFVGQDPESSEKQREFQYQQARAQRRRGSKITNVSSTEKASLITEMQLSDNPYTLTEGFDQLG